MKRLLCAAALVVGAASASQAATTTIGFTFDISGDANVPDMVLTNTSASALINGVSLTIGDTDMNFDQVYTGINTAPVGGGFSIVTGDTAQGGARTDLVALSFTGFGAGLFSEFGVDVDRDTVDTVEDYRDIFFNNGGQDNAELTVSFSTGHTLSLIMGDGVRQRDYHFSLSDRVAISTVPLPAGLPLLVGALGLVGFAGRRRAR